MRESTNRSMPQVPEENLHVVVAGEGGRPPIESGNGHPHDGLPQSVVRWSSTHRARHETEKAAMRRRAS